MEIIVAKSAGFCAGVRKAVETAYKCSESNNCCTFGPLIHNRHVTDELGAKGVACIDSLKEANGRNVIIRSHGVPPEVYSELDSLGISYVDCTCRDVKKIHELIRESFRLGKKIIIAGQKDHPEVIACNGITGYTAVVLSSREQAEQAVFCDDGEYILLAQTTFSVEEYAKIVDVLSSRLKRLDVKNTICGATSARQKEASEIAKNVDAMIILGDKTSSNSIKLYETCKNFNENTFFVESINDLQLKFIASSGKIGLTAGASTPPVIIKEALQLMSELEKKNDKSFEELLSENIVSLHTGDVVKGTVIQINNGEVSVNLGYKSDGIIQKGEFSEDPDADPAAVLKSGDIISVFVIHVNDVDGTVLLSKKRIDYLNNIEEIEKAVESKAVLNGKIIETVKGGAIAVINGLRAFVPSSQISNRFVEDIDSFKGKELGFNILEYDKGKRKIIAGRRELATKLIEEQKAKAFETIEVGQSIDGTVSRLTDFGAFVDLGGVDGLVHVSEISWNRIRRPSDVLKVGDKIRAYVIDVNKEKGKISLSIKNLLGDPWATAEEKYAPGNIVEGTVVRMTDFGAFVALEEGIDGLLHISQISDKRIQKPSDVLSIGDTVTVKVTELNLETKRISLSKKQYEKQLAYEAGEASMLGIDTEHVAEQGEECERACCCEEAPADIYHDHGEPEVADKFFEKDNN